MITWASAQPDWVIGFLDEVWWSRFARPRMHAWQDENHPVHLVKQSWKKGDPDPKALHSQLADEPCQADSFGA